jgi:hypothetical protein
MDTCPALSSADAEAAPFDDQIASFQERPGRIASAGPRNVQPTTAPAAPSRATPWITVVPTSKRVRATGLGL